jgi:hypothetical protein
MTYRAWLLVKLGSCVVGYVLCVIALSRTFREGSRRSRGKKGE